MKNQNIEEVQNLESALMSQRLLAVLKQYKDRPFVLVEPGGNHGDMIIYKGFHKLVKAAGLTFRSMLHDEYMKASFSENTVIYIHGGGGFIPIWSGTPSEALKKAVATHRGIVIVGPTTFVDDDNYLSKVFANCLSDKMCSKLYMFSREEKSFSILKRYVPAWVEIDKDHDTALNLSREDFNLNGIEGRYKLYAIRYDKEMNSKELYNYFRWMDPIDVCKTFDEWVRFHAQAKEIITNRTHSSVLGAVLKIPTILMANSYHKNRSIWEFSLQSRGVIWKDQLSGGWVNRVIESRGRLKNFFTSSKYRSFRKNLLVNYSL